MIQNYNDFYINLYSRVENDISEAMKAIASEFHKDNKLTTSVKYVLESHGKLVRPLFLYLCYLTLSKEVNKELKYIAAAIELIHTASLVHDDIIDNGLVRRGKETIFKHYGMPTAVLTGDLLIFLSMKIIAKCTLDSNKTLQVIQLLNETLCSMCIGQASEDKLIGNLQNDKKEYLQIIGLKTAQFFSTVCRISGFLAEGNDFEVSALTNFGYNVGMAYQIRDDVLSLIGDNEECNKTLESDLDRRLVTLPVIIAYEAGNQRQKDVLIKYFKDLKGKANYDLICETLKGTRAFESAFVYILEYIFKAREALNALKNSEAKDILVGFLTTFLLETRRKAKIEVDFDKRFEELFNLA